jgi:hypothetical protein
VEPIQKKAPNKTRGGGEKFNKRTTLQPEQKSTTPEKDQIKREIVREGIKKKPERAVCFDDDRINQQNKHSFFSTRTKHSCAYLCFCPFFFFLFLFFY